MADTETGTNTDTTTGNDAAGTGAETPGTLLTDTPADAATTGQDGNAKPGDADDKGTAGKQGDGEDKGKGTDAPKPYELTAPEGYPINAGALKGLNDMCKAANLNEEQGKAVMAYMQGNYTTAMAAQQESMQTQAKAWIGEFKADKDFGGDKFDASLADARKALATFDKGGAVSKMLNETGYGNNPDVLRIFARVGQALGEDQLVGKGGGGAEEKPLEDRFYPNM